MSEMIAAGKVVSLSYTLRDDDGDVIDASEAGDPLAYLHGAGNIVPGLERQLTGRKVGDKLKAAVPPEEGYGVRESDGTEEVPREAFPPDAELEAGMQIFAHPPEGDPIPMWIVEVTKEVVRVDLEHPLAGVTLHFDLEVLAVRDATAEEMAHGHPHGEGGHHH